MEKNLASPDTPNFLPKKNYQKVPKLPTLCKFYFPAQEYLE
jgi:hypothetical protein